MSSIRNFVIFLVALAPSILMAGVQQISATPQSIFATAGQGFEINVGYSTDDPSLTGVGAKLFFDSSKIQLVQVDAVYQSGRLAIDQQSRPDSKNADGDASTDQVLNAAWFDIGGNWPGQSSISLFTARFVTRSDFSGTTSIQFKGDAAANSRVIVPTLFIQGDNAAGDSAENGQGDTSAEEDGRPDSTQDSNDADQDTQSSDEPAADPNNGSNQNGSNQTDSSDDNAGTTENPDPDAVDQNSQPDSDNGAQNETTTADSSDTAANSDGSGNGAGQQPDPVDTTSNSEIETPNGTTESTDESPVVQGDSREASKGEASKPVKAGGNGGLSIYLLLFFTIATLTTLVFRGRKKNDH